MRFFGTRMTYSCTLAACVGGGCDWGPPEPDAVADDGAEVDGMDVLDDCWPADVADVAPDADDMLDDVLLLDAVPICLGTEPTTRIEVSTD